MAFVYEGIFCFMHHPQLTFDLHPESALINTSEINVAVHNIHY